MPMTTTRMNTTLTISREGICFTAPDANLGVKALGLRLDIDGKTLAIRYGTAVEQGGTVAATGTAGNGINVQTTLRPVDGLRAAWGDPAADFVNPPLPGIEERTHSDIGGFRAPAQPRSRWIQDFLDCYNDHPTRMLTQIFDRVAPTPSRLHPSAPTARPSAAAPLRETSPSALLPARDRIDQADGINRFFPSTFHPQPSTLPQLFHGVFGMAVMNTAYSGVQTMPGENRPVLEHPALGFITCCLTYCDRKAGGVSVYMNAGYHSHTLHGKLAIGEADIRPGTANDVWNEATLEDGVASMRREFAAMRLCQRQGLWYFDMPGGWFDRPELLAELSRQQQVGQALLDLPHTNVAETLVVFENRSWKYFGLADHKLALKTVWSGGNQQLLSDMTQDNIERLQRLGAPNDAIVGEDFCHPDLGDYKLLIFPFSFLCDPATRTEIHRRVEAGSTALFLYAAGIVDGETASVENMTRLLGMTVRVDGPGVLAAELTWDGHLARPDTARGGDGQDARPTKGGGDGQDARPTNAGGDGQDARPTKGGGDGQDAHPTNAGGDGQDARPTKGDSQTLGNPNTHHFRYVIDDPRVTPLARYADGSVAAAMIPRGRGRIILSAVPAASPALYKLAAKLAGVHLYSDTDDALYASGEFLTIHTRTAGAKRLRFPRVVPQVTDVFTGEVVARNVNEVTINLPAKITAVYCLRESPLFLKQQ